MRTLLLFVTCLALALAVHSGVETLARFGRPIPLHVPTQSVDSNDTFDVPYWLGAYYATVNATAIWTLPLTIGNGGQTYPGEFLFIVNYGPATITLLPQAPETIDAVSSYVIQPGTTVQFISGYPDWIVVVASSSQIQNIYTFDGYDAAADAPAFTVEIGPSTYNPPPYSSCMVGNCSNWQVVSIGSRAGQFNTGYRATNIGYATGWYNTGNELNNIGYTAGAYNTGSQVNNLGSIAGRNNTGTYVNNIGSSAGASNIGSQVNNIGRQAGQYNTGGNVNNFGQLAGQNNTGSFCSHNGFTAGQTNTFDYCHTNGRTSACTTANQFVFGASLYPLHLRLPSDAGSYCTGAAYDTCLNRAAANAWTFNAGTSLRVPQYFSVGAATAPSNTATGAITTTKATPTLQAFGAVTANAASGVLAFTVSTAAVTCATAVITNTNVVAGSEIILTIQTYTGVKFTNGFPVVSRLDTTGSSVGSFTLELCNTHATNALSGNLYVAFWVLN